ncbi:MAG: hypothetical protein ACK4RK_18235 [Gemmataceae bacterium]
MATDTEAREPSTDSTLPPLPAAGAAAGATPPTQTTDYRSDWWLMLWWGLSFLLLWLLGLSHLFGL